MAFLKLDFYKTNAELLYEEKKLDYYDLDQNEKEKKYNNIVKQKSV
jgi:hypothetical protein